MRVISNSTTLSKQFDKISVEMSQEIRSEFLKGLVPPPDAVDDLVVNVQQKLANTLSGLTVSEFIQGAVNSAPPSWRRANSVQLSAIQTSVSSIATPMLSSLKPGASYIGTMCKIVEQNYVAIGARAIFIDNDDWIPLTNFVIAEIIFYIGSAEELKSYQEKYAREHIGIVKRNLVNAGAYFHSI